MSADQNKATARKFYDLYGQGDLDAIAQTILAENVTVHFSGIPGPMDLEAYRQVGAMFRVAFPDGHMTIEQQIADGDVVVTRSTFRGTHNGPLQGMPATGRKVELVIVVIDRFAGGRIIERWDASDQLGMMMQLGAIPAPAAS
jgi:steroid delta-isomerase-like uncharacterized protein